MTPSCVGLAHPAAAEHVDGLSTSAPSLGQPGEPESGPAFCSRTWCAHVQSVCAECPTCLCSWWPFGPCGYAHSWPPGLRASFMGELAVVCAQACCALLPRQRSPQNAHQAQRPGQPVTSPLGFLPGIGARTARAPAITSPHGDKIDKGLWYFSRCVCVTV